MLLTKNNSLIYHTINASNFVIDILRGTVLIAVLTKPHKQNQGHLLAVISVGLQLLLQLWYKMNSKNVLRRSIIVFYTDFFLTTETHNHKLI